MWVLISQEVWWNLDSTLVIKRYMHYLTNILLIWDASRIFFAAFLLSVSRFRRGMENSNASCTEVRNPKTLRIRDRHSPSANVWQCPAAFDFAGGYPNPSRKQAQGAFVGIR